MLSKMSLNGIRLSEFLKIDCSVLRRARSIHLQPQDIKRQASVLNANQQIAFYFRTVKRWGETKHLPLLQELMVREINFPHLNDPLDCPPSSKPVHRALPEGHFIIGRFQSYS